MATEAQNLSREMAHAYLTGTAPRTNRLSSPACQPIMTSIMQNKANFRKAEMNVSFFSTKDYENKSNWKLGKNKANTKPLKANLLHPQMNVSSALTKDYSNEQRTMNNERLCKTNPIKPNFIRLRRIQRQKSAAAFDG